MKRYVAITGLLLLTWALTGQAEVLSGRIARIETARLKSALLPPRLCGEKGRQGSCSALSVSNVVVTDSSGNEHKIGRLLLETETHSGQTDMTPSNSVVTFAMAFAPKDQWDDVDQFVESLEPSALQYVYIDPARATAVGRLTITVRYRPAIIENWTAISGEPKADPAAGAIALEYGTNVNLQSLSH